MGVGSLGLCDLRSIHGNPDLLFAFEVVLNTPTNS